jgi:hypothetical protein
VLTSECSGIIVLDGDGTVPNQSIYLFRLATPDGKVLWTKKFTFAERKGQHDYNAHAVELLVKRLTLDLKKARDRGGSRP